LGATEAVSSLANKLDAIFTVIDEWVKESAEKPVELLGLGGGL